MLPGFWVKVGMSQRLLFKWERSHEDESSEALSYEMRDAEPQASRSKTVAMTCNIMLVYAPKLWGIPGNKL